ncbi:tetraacyldisaccharide 4'-kinase [Oceanicoccus sagamiensis]|uniref:Tetraacyldisaccharide 4'-kinase n=1 Tax=Oceanicoccus sagamiensis TaxID=716816 RepID=A0A1X9NK63_9GAMM|nr:tetraacyldisaccharide 4'-kinase [Oceanicoccus sagamiensis]ARN75839.1 tetraacyldisaccharide 4'-kinase [Oceanicoccus sagamiensis]
MVASSHEHRLVHHWYQQSLGLYLLAPFSLLYFLITAIRRQAYRWGLLSSFKPPVPTIVVGNITVGGAGKTPVVIALVKALQQQGFNPGVISRGYGSKAPSYPYAVTSTSQPEHSGDEPLLIAQQSDAPVVIDGNRKNAVEMLIEQYQCDVVVSDDGLQHYALQRDIEIAVVDVNRGFGSGWLMPVGPLRELLSRLSQVDFIIGNGDQSLGLPAPAPFYSMQLQATALQAVTNDTMMAIEQWPHSKRVHAVAGIGNPQRFFTTLRDLGFEPVEHAFPDHYSYCADDFQFAETLPIIMTEKDAVKVRAIQQPPQHCWSLPVAAAIDSAFYHSINQQLRETNHEL